MSARLTVRTGLARGGTWVFQGLVLGLAMAMAGEPAPPVAEILVTNDLRLEPGKELRARLVVRASHLTIDGRGGTLVGPGTVGDPASLQNAGLGILLEGCSDITIRNVSARGFATGLVLRDCRGVRVTDSDFSDNYHNPAHGWGELPNRGGIILERSCQCVLRKNRANRVWDGLQLRESHENLIEDNDFSRCSNTCGKLWTACRNRWLRNNLSYGLRIDRAAGEVHARDSTSVLIESGSDDNYWEGNDITHGGDGVFIRVLNAWVSRGNVFVDNDMSYANNNCVESWSPGNTYIRNKANHGSYGFWLGGSDQTVLLGNEAAWNGLPSGFHNAPEAGFGHGGIVIVGGSSSHTLIEGNYCHDNAGAGIAFRGDDASRGGRWRTHHWVVQQNRLENNRWGIWGRWGDWMHLANNLLVNNALTNRLEDVRRLAEPPFDPQARRAPWAALAGPTRVRVGEVARFDARASRDFEDRPLAFEWSLGDAPATGPVVEHRFARAGFHRVGLTVHNGTLAGLAFRDLVVYEDCQEIGTEGQASQWSFDMENNGEGRGRIRFEDDPDALVGSACLRWRPDPYMGAYATAILRSSQPAGWNWQGRKALRFWLKVENPNIPGFQNAGPVIRLATQGGAITLKPEKGGNLLVQQPYSEARWTWQEVTVPLAGGAGWEREQQGEASLEAANAIHLSLDSWGGDPFTVWVDGLHVE